MASKRISSSASSSRDKSSVVKRRRTSSPADDNLSDVDSAASDTVEDKVCCGIIEKMVLKNFVCHEKLTIELGRSVNFITGQNGSGKSAILSGIVLGLGGNAGLTGRGSSVKSFIKSRKVQGETQVVLLNSGFDPYKPDLYGKRIIIERKIKQDSSEYKIKSERGKVVSTKKEELLNINDAFNIQLDNPVTVLNQESSRHFLHSNSDAKKYLFFLRASLLEIVSNNYVSTLNTIEETKAILHRKKQAIPTLKKDLAIAKKKFESFRSLESLRKRVEQLKHEMAWSISREAQLKANEARKEFTTAEACTSKFQKKVDESEDKKKTSKEELDDIETVIKELSEELEKLNPSQDDFRRSRDDKKKEAASVRAQLKNLAGQIDQNQKDSESLTKKINELRILADGEDQLQMREQKLRKMKDERANYEAQLECQTQTLQQIKDASEHEGEQLKQIRLAKAEQERKLQSYQRNLTTLQSSKDNRLKRFGSFMPELNNSIEKCHKEKRFNKRPVGPLGAELTLRDEKWAPAVQVCLAGLLYAFCADNHKERQILNQLMKKHCAHKPPNIITSRFLKSVHDVSRNMVQHAPYQTILGVIDIKNPVVINCLIDQRMIEGVLLVESTAQARDLMLNNPPKNCREAFSLNGTQFYPIPKFRMYSNKDKNYHVLTADVEASIKTFQSMMQDVQNSLRKCSQDETAKVKAIEDNHKLKKKHQQTQQRLKNQINKLGFDIQELSSDKEPSKFELDTLEADLRQYQELGQEIASRKQEAEARLVEIEEDIQKIEEENKSVLTNCEAFRTQRDEKTVYLTKLRSKFMEANRNLAHYKTKLDEHLQKVDNLRDRLKELDEKKETTREKASAICEKIETCRKSTNINSEIQQITLQIEKEEKAKGTEAAATRDYHEKKTQFIKIYDDVVAMGNFLQDLEDSVKVRRSRLKLFIKSTATVTKTSFNNLLNNRGFHGSMAFNHREGTLHIDVQVTPSSAGLTTRDLRSLSGGERSFSTVCFILALWRCIESPFRILDEFDVFMDMVNRRMAMHMMLNMSHSLRSHQFIFLTPQDWSNLQVESNVRILYLEAPRHRSGHGELAEEEEH